MSSSEGPFSRSNGCNSTMGGSVVLSAVPRLSTPVPSGGKTSASTPASEGASKVGLKVALCVLCCPGGGGGTRGSPLQAPVLLLPGNGGLAATALGGASGLGRGGGRCSDPAEGCGCCPAGLGRGRGSGAVACGPPAGGAPGAHIPACPGTTALGARTPGTAPTGGGGGGGQAGGAGAPGCCRCSSFFLKEGGMALNGTGRCCGLGTLPSKACQSASTCRRKSQSARRGPSSTARQAGYAAHAAAHLPRRSALVAAAAAVPEASAAGPAGAAVAGTAAVEAAAAGVAATGSAAAAEASGARILDTPVVAAECGRCWGAEAASGPSSPLPSSPSE
mmetsp:Transcript_64535/g.204035  ORF Transcript_64535/g.204035 Transcript_64535/m.204035 type:complete len:334 (+) Transcript_64535:1173-2174(+)